MERIQIGWQVRDGGVTPIYKTMPGQMATAAIIWCSLCRKGISGRGGPRYRAYCMACGPRGDWA